LKKTLYSRYQEVFRRKMVAIREAAGLSQRDLAKRLGRPPSVVAHIEIGQRRVDTAELYAICRACGTDPRKVAAELMDAYKRLDNVRTKIEARPRKQARMAVRRKS
jgi:transcriptional regulator with XRE-family HTH domain